MAALALVGIVTTLVIAEPEKRIAAGTAEREGKVADFAAGLGAMPSWLRETLIFLYGAIVCPFVDFFVRYRWHGVILLAFIGLFRLSRHRHGGDGEPVLYRHRLHPGSRSPA